MPRSRRKTSPASLDKVSKIADSASKPIALITSVLALVSSLFWYRTDSEKKELDLKLSRLDLRLKAGQTAAAEPQFVVQYLMCGGSVFADMLGGSNGSRLAGTVEELRDQVKGRKGVSDALDRFLGFPVVNVRLRDQKSNESLDLFLQENLKVRLKDKDLVGVGYFVISIAAYGGQTVRDVKVIAERHSVLDSTYFLSEKATFGEQVFDDPLSAPIEGRNLKTKMVPTSISVGDIVPPGGVNIPLRIYYEAYDTTSLNGTDPGVGATVFTGEFLVPKAIEYKNVLGEKIRINIRPPLDYPMPVCDYIDIAG